MMISLLDVQVGKRYLFGATNDFVFSPEEGLVLDKDRNGNLTLLLSGENEGRQKEMPFAPWIYAEPLPGENSASLLSQIAQIGHQLDGLTAAKSGKESSSPYLYENDAIDALEEWEDPDAARFYLTHSFPVCVFNSLPFVLNRNESNRLVFQLLIRALDLCASDPGSWPDAYMPLFPDQNDLYSPLNFEIVRRVARSFRKIMPQQVLNHHEFRFEGVITMFTGDHGYISVSDVLSLRFNKEGILDSRLLKILRQGITTVGWIEVSFSVSRVQSGHYACRLRLTSPAVFMAEHLGLLSPDDSEEVPGSYEASAICGTSKLPPSLRDLLASSESSRPMDPVPTKRGTVISAAPYEDGTSPIKGVLSCEGMEYSFHALQVCDESLMERWRQGRLQGTPVLFEPAFNHTRNAVSLSADFVRSEAFSVPLPPAHTDGDLWLDPPYAEEELSAFLAHPDVPSDFSPLQPWLNAFQGMIGDSQIGKINPHGSKQKCWIYLARGRKFGFSFSQIQDELLYVLINSSLRTTIDWSQIDICFVSRKSGGMYYADHVILTAKSRIELAHQYGLNLPALPLSNRFILVPRRSFMPLPFAESVQPRQSPDPGPSDPVSVEEPDAAEVSPTPGITQDIGILLPFSPSAPCGYIGKKFYTKACRVAELPRGDARFDPALLSFPVDRDYVYIVRYSYATSSARAVKTVLSIEYQDRVPYATLGSLSIEEDGEVVRMPLINVIAHYYLHRSVNLSLAGGKLLSGTVDAADQNAFTLTCGGKTETVPFEEIEKLCIRGFVTAYTPSRVPGGVLDNSFSFRIGGFASPMEAGRLSPGLPVVYRLQGVPRDNGIEAFDIQLINLEKKETVLVERIEENRYAAVVPDDYGIAFLPSRDILEIHDVPPTLDFSAYDYTVTLLRQPSSAFWLWENGSVRKTEKLCSGILTSFSGDMATIRPETQLPNQDFDRTYRCPDRIFYSPDGEDYRPVDTSRFDYQILYRLIQPGEEQLLRVVRVCQAIRKKKTGWLFKYITANDEYGFIVSDAEARTVHFEWNTLDRSQNRYCRRTDMVNPPDVILTRNGAAYRVSYLERTNYNGRITAQEIEFLDDDPQFPGRASPARRPLPAEPAAPPQPASGPISSPGGIQREDTAPAAADPPSGGSSEETGSPSVPEEPLFETLQISLSEESPLDQNEAYAVLRAYSSKFPEVKFYPDYIQDYHPETPVPPFAVAGSGLSFSDPDEERIQTTKYLYVVRLTLLPRQASEEAGPLPVDDTVPAVVLKKYRRKQVQSIRIEGGTLTVVRKLAQAAPAPAAAAAPVSAPPSPPPASEAPLSLHPLLPGFVPGENLYFVSSEGNRVISRYRSTLPDGKVETENGLLDPAGGTLFRFGIITEFDESMSWGVLNQSGIRFPLSLLEEKTYNMLKNQRRQMLVLYQTVAGQLQSVTRPDEKLRSLLAWQEGTVTAVVDDPARCIRCLVIGRADGESSVRHNISTMTDGYVSSLIKKKSIIGKQIYYRFVLLPMKNGEPYPLTASAVDVHMLSEEEALIDYDESSGKFFAVRNQTWKEELNGPSEILEGYVNKRAEVIFDNDGTRLTARLAEAAYAEEYDELDTLSDYSPRSVLNTELALFLQRRLRISQYASLDFENAARTVSRLYPVNNRLTKADHLACIAFLARKHYGEEEVFSYHGQTRSPSLLINSFLIRLGDIPSASMNVDEYACYAVDYANVVRDSDIPLALYRVFQPDFNQLTEISAFESRMHAPRPLRTEFIRRFSEASLLELFSKPLRGQNSLIPHLLQISPMLRDYLVTNILSQSPSAEQAIRSWAAERGQRTEGVLLASLLNESLQAENRITGALKRALLRVQTAEQFTGIDIQPLLPYVCATDALRLRSFAGVYHSIPGAEQQGYSGRVQALNHAMEETEELTKEIESQPTPAAIELLYNTGILSFVQSYAEKRLNQIYADPENRPILTCECNDNIIQRHAALSIVVENRASARQEARSVSLSLESYTDGVSVTRSPLTRETRLPSTTLSPGARTVFIADIMVEEDVPADQAISLGWTVSYTHVSGAVKDQISQSELHLDGSFTLQLAGLEQSVDKSQVKNPYEKYTSGVLKDDTMFIGRQSEKREIMHFLLNDQDRFNAGRVVIVYGQKKCGKTSLLYQVTNELEARGAGQQKAIILKMETFLADVSGAVMPGDFYPEFYTRALDLLRSRIQENYPDLYETLRDEGMAPPRSMWDYKPSEASIVFRNYIHEFQKAHGSEYQIVLLLDEFTGWCARLAATFRDRPEALDSLLFVKLLSDIGMILILIGHDNMLRALSTLGKYNQIAQFAKITNISAFTKESGDAETLIRQPMKDRFGFDPYDCPLGRAAVENILTLSGRSPYVLMTLCSHVFEKYKSFSRMQLTDLDIRDVVRKMVSDDTVLQLQFFNFLVEEDGDENMADDLRPTFRYLKYIAQHYHPATDDCDADIQCDELTREQNESIRSILEDRKVISRQNNRIRINVDLFRQFILYRFGKS